MSMRLRKARGPPEVPRTVRPRALPRFRERVTAAAPTNRIVHFTLIAHLRSGSIPVTVPGWSARRDPRGGPTSVARREELLTVWQGLSQAGRSAHSAGHSEQVAR